MVDPSVERAKTGGLLDRRKRGAIKLEADEEPSSEVLAERKILSNENSVYLQSIYESVQMGYRTQMVGRVVAYRAREEGRNDGRARLPLSSCLALLCSPLLPSALLPSALPPSALLCSAPLCSALLPSALAM